MQDFDYIRVREVQEAISILAGDGNGARVLSGGTDLLPQLRERQRIAKLLVDIKSIPELNELKYHPSEGLTLGAAVSCLRISSDPSSVAELIFGDIGLRHLTLVRVYADPP